MTTISDLSNQEAEIMARYRLSEESCKRSSLLSYDNLIINEDTSFIKKKSYRGNAVKLSDNDNIIGCNDRSKSLKKFKNKETKVPDTLEKNDTIIISDSSDNDESFMKKINDHTNIYIVSSTDESEETEDIVLKYTESRNETKISCDNQSTRGRKKNLLNFCQDQKTFKVKQRCSILYTSDDTASTISSSKSKSTSKESKKSAHSHTNSTPLTNLDTSRRSSRKFFSNNSNKSAYSSPSHISTTPRSLDSNNSLKYHKSNSETHSKYHNRIKNLKVGSNPSYCSTKFQRSFSHKINNPAKKLTKLEALRILKSVKSKSQKYFSSTSSNKSQVSEAQDSSRGQRQERIDKSNVIEETDSESEREIVPEIQDTLVSIQEQGYNDLSARKRKEIANWILANSPDSKDTSTASHVSNSNRNSLSSGNSSLERLEMNYETPNNRERFLKKTIETDGRLLSTDLKNSTSNVSKALNGITLLDTNKRVNVRTPQSDTTGSIIDNSQTKVISRQTRIDDYLRKAEIVAGQDGDVTPQNRVFRTPLPIIPKPFDPDDVKLEDCVDILDKLYGDTWRAKAHVILSEPRKQNIVKRDRGVQTERKIKPNSQTHSNSLSESDDNIDSGRLIKNVKAKTAMNVDLYRTVSSKKTQKSSKKNSFINDEPSSGESGRSSYHTALMNPTFIDINKKVTSTPASVKIQRLIAICDPESDDETRKTLSRIEKKDEPNRRKLTYSDDEISSSTSEFDPEDIIPRKSIPKKSTNFSSGYE